MKIGVDKVAWLVDELAKQIEAGYKWAVYECSGSEEEFQHIHFYKRRVEALDYCGSKIGNNLRVMFEETSILQEFMKNIYNSDKNRNDIDYYVVDDLSYVVSRVLKANPDQNPLHNPEGNKFTDELISHFEMKNSDNKIDLATLLYPSADTSDGDNLLNKKRDNNGKGLRM